VEYRAWRSQPNVMNSADHAAIIPMRIRTTGSLSRVRICAAEAQDGRRDRRAGAGAASSGSVVAIARFCPVAPTGCGEGHR
jgi:hypothetical protein